MLKVYPKNRQVQLMERFPRIWLSAILFAEQRCAQGVVMGVADRRRLPK